MADNSSDTVTTVDIDLDNFFPGITLDEPKDSTPTVLSNDTPEVDLNTLDLKDEEVEKEAPPAPDNTVMNSIDDDLEKGQLDFEEAKQGSTSDLRDFIKAKIEAGELIPFDDYVEGSNLDDYLKTFKKKDFDELWQSNLTAHKQGLEESVPQDFINALPEELRFAAKYVMEGGKDLKKLFHHLAAVEEIRELDPKTDSERLATEYLRATQFGDEDEIKEQVEEWKDLGKLEANAEKFKPKLARMNEQIVQAKITQAAEEKAELERAYNTYNNSILEAIKTADLGGIKINAKLQNELYNGLTQGGFTDSKGRNVTEFSYLIDKIMWQEPNPKLLAKVQWLLKDEQGFEEALLKKGAIQNTEKTVRTLKTEQSRRSGTAPEETPSKINPIKNRIPRNSGNIFSR